MNTFRVYANLGGVSGIVAYKVDNDTIHVQFEDGRVYIYRAADIGASHFAELVKLAEAGKGLNAYINKNKDVAKGWYKKYLA